MAIVDWVDDLEKFDPTYPVNKIDGNCIISPEGIIQLALSKYRNSPCSDSKLSEYISELLSLIMSGHDLVISQSDVRDSELRFKILTFQKAK